MRIPLSLLSVVLAASAAVLGPVAPAAAAPAAAPAVDVRPGALDRGPAPSAPHVVGSTIVDGGRRIPVAAEEVRLLGTSGRAYVVAVSSGRGPGPRVLRVRPDGSTRVLARRTYGDALLGADGETLVHVRPAGRGSRVTVIDARTGRSVATRRVRGDAELLDVETGRVLLTTYGPDRTLVWRSGADRVRTVLRRAAGLGDLGSDRLAWIAGDPYAGGCTRLARVSDPSDLVWRSCRDAVASISPDGSRLLTLHKLTDGVGSRELRMRRADGTLLATYRVKGWFRGWFWEDDRTIVAGANGRSRYALVRCAGDDCERAGATEPAHQERAA
ncbi:hypothetical protein [Nocardioides dongkuii]|uniref:hypothetical protein n=1 Tax=Nocardioides dongkuii TaxID=2760089 RepID=UPI0015FE7564|nr:hypothetical protein [Nocardioides dongkuii]